MHNETEGKLTLRLIPTSKGPYTRLVYKKTANLISPQNDAQTGETTLHQDEKTTTSEVDSLPKMLDLIRMIIYNVFLTF